MPLKTRYLLFCLIASWLFGNTLYAQWNYERPQEGVLQGTGFSVGSNTVVQDDKLPYPALMSTIQNNYRKEAVVALSTHENTSVTLPSSYYCEVAVTVDWWDENNNLTTEYKKLSVSFNADTLHPDTTISYYTFSGAHKVKVTITDIYTEGLSTPLPDIFSVTANLLFERDYVFQCSVNAQATGKYYNSSEDELLVTWQTYNSFLLSNVPGIQFKYDHECDLEWTFYDDGSELVRNYVGGGAHPYTSAAFKNNASRVVCSNYQYQLPLLYSSGYLMFRIRPVKVLPNGQRIAGEWSSDVFAGSSDYIYHISAGHENKLNWQASTTFAEEGKRKSVISYFDGSSKNRQTVTKINTNKMAVVAETIYDNEGRPVATVLPTPAFNQAIQHFDKFNQDMLGNAYTWEDLNATACVPSPGQMSTNSGASKYYSPNNPMQATLPYSNIPDAFKYPFAQTKYTGDLTNRVRASAGPGKDHHFGAAGDRFTKYLYGQPEQTDLTKMFGTEVGEKSHYFKNLVIDPNGQVSVTYQDMHGRTIATALSGDAVNVELDTLDGEDRDTVMLRDAIIDGINQTTTGLSINSTKTFLVSRRALHKFYYSLMPESYIINTCDGKTFCYDCVYDLTIRVTDECGQQLHLLTKRNYTPSDDSGVYFDTSCANNPLPIVDSFELELGVGEYTVSKSLAIAQDAIDYYYNDYISKDTCIKDFEDFYSAALNELDMTGCEFTCESCLQALGDSTTFIDSFFRQILKDNPGAIITEHDTDNAVVAYLQLREVCDMLCDSFSVCDAKRNLMLHDMSPTGGQYASYYYNISNNTYVFTAVDSPFTNTSILSPNATIYPPGMTLPLYSDPGIVYLDELGNPDYVSISDIDGDGVLDPVTPNQLTQEQFIQNWRPSWAKSLLRFHPEYCDLQFCEIISSSHEYDKRMLAVEDYQTAVTDGFLNPLNDNHSEVPATFIPGTNPDPFFAGIYGTTYANSMKSIMRSYITGTYSGGTLDYSLWELAALSAQCAINDSLPCSGCTENFYWNTFRNIYLGKKRYWVDEAMKAYYHDCHTSAGGNASLLSYPNFNSGALTGCTPRFEIVSDIFDNIYSNELQGDEHQQAANAEQIVHDNAFDCSSYANYWWTQLQGCGYSVVDSPQIIGMLIDVCRAGTDPQHIFGASTAAPGSTGFTSFQQVLQWAQANLTSANNYESPNCSEHLINNPLPYEVKTLYYQSAQVDKPEQCICDNIQLYHFQYLHSGLSGTMNFGDYLTNVRNVIITNEDIEMLMQSCQPGACARLDHPISLPYQFGCDNNCASCEQVVDVYHNFQSHFDTMPFGHPNYMTLMQSYMNQSLHMNLTALEYIRFMVDSCGYTDFPGPGELPNQPNTLVKQGNGVNKTDATRTGNLTEDGRFKPFASYNGNSTAVLVSGYSNSTPALFAADLANADLLKRHTTQVNIVDSIDAIYSLLKNNGSAPHVIASNVPAWGSSFIQKKSPHNAAMQSSIVLLKRRIINAAMARNSSAANTQKLQQGVFNTNPSTLRVPPVSNNLVPVTANSFTNNNHSVNAYNTAYGTAMGTQANANVSTPAQQPAYTTALQNLPQISSGVGANPTATQVAPKARLKRYARYVATTTLSQPDRNTNNRQQRGLTIPVSQTPVTDATRQILNVINLPAQVSQQRGNGIFNVYNADNKPSLTNTGTNSHQVQYFITEQDNWCDSVAASIQVFDSLPYRDWWWFVTTMQDNLGVSYPLAYWLSIVDTCNLPCTELVRCSRADSVLQQFAVEFPQYAGNSLPQIWVTYLNQNNGTGYYTSYNVDEWPLLLNCCNVNYPAADTGTYCDKLNQLVTFDYFKPDLYYLMYSLNFVFGASHYSPALGTVIANNLDYWVQQADSCGTPCSEYINCQRIDSVMDKFEANYPQYATNSLAYLWVNYLNQNYAAGGYFTYGQNDWVTMLNCCGINYPAADTAATHCDTLQTVVDLYASQGLYNVAYQLDQFYGSTHFDSATSSYVNNDIAYWLQQMNSCNIPCSAFISCESAGNVMNDFRTQYPQFATNSMPSFWVDYLNNHNASGNYTSYNYDTWVQLLNCCNISYPATDSVTSYCDSLELIINYYKYQGVPAVVTMLGSNFGYSHYNAETESWVTSTLGYWLQRMDSCNIPCTAIVSCGRADTVMQQFKNMYPQYATSCDPSLWVNYFNSYFTPGVGTGFTTSEWVALLNCCNVSYPEVDTIVSHCDSVAAIFSMYQYYGASTIVYQLNNAFGSTHYAGGQLVNNDFAYWLTQFNSCGLPCSAFVNCTQLSAVMQQFKDNNPQFADSSASAFWVQYLNQNNGSGMNVTYTLAEWQALMQCCGVTPPVNDTTSGRCDIIQFIVTSYQWQGAGSVASQLSNAFGWSHYDSVAGTWIYHDLAYWLNEMDSCGISCGSLINCTQLNTVMQQFRTQYPQYANYCLPSLWVNYLNTNNASGTWNAYNENDWRAFMNCCNVEYPQPDTSTSPCAVIQAIYAVYASQGLNAITNQLNIYYGWGHTDPVTGLWVYNDLAYWLGRLDSCGISCNTLVNCTLLNNAMQQFNSTYPQFATSCPQFILVNYLNSKNISGSWNNYSYSEWIAMLNCCGINIPANDTLGTYCDTLQAAATMGAGGNVYNTTSLLNNLFGWSHYDPATGNWVYHDLNYWISRMDSCGIPCSSFFNCTTLASVMNDFRTQYPQYASYAPSPLWVNYLNTHNGSGTGNWYGLQDWLTFLNCCGVQYPAADTTTDTCQLINQIAVYALSQGGYNNLANLLNDQFGWSHYDAATGNWYSNNLDYWIQRMDSCGITCDVLHDCSKVDSIMTDFYEAYPAYTTSAPQGVWVTYLNQHGASNGVWYNADDWIRILKCCGISIPSEQSGSTHCDSVAMALSYYNSMGNNTLWNLETAMASVFGWGYNDPVTGMWQNYSDMYWLDMIRGCGYPCPSIIKCTEVNTLLTQFYNLYPQYTNNAPGAIWAAYLNNHEAGHGNWYNPQQWAALLSCCNITLPTDTGYDYCETMAGVVATNPAVSQFPNLPALYQMRSVYGWGYNDPVTGDWVNYPVSYYINLLDSCNIPCTALIDSVAMATALQQFYTDNPQYADSCPPMIMQPYLNSTLLNDQEWLPYEDWATLAGCSGIPFPAIDTVLSTCDSAFMLNGQISMIENILIDTLGEPCVPAWLYKVIFMEHMPDFSLSNACEILNSCGYQCPDTCVLYSHCDSIKSIVHTFQVISTYNNDGGDDGGEMIAQIASFIMGQSYTYGQLMQEYIMCDTGYFCTNIPGLTEMLEPLFNSFDSCVHVNVYVGVMNGMTGLNMNYAQWCSMLAACDIPCPVVCTDSLAGRCDTFMLAYQTYLNVIANYPVGDSTHALTDILSYVFNRTITLAEAQSMISKCLPRPCLLDSTQKANAQLLFGYFGDCAPAWVVPYAYNNLVGSSPDHPLTPQQMCDVFAACGINCPDTCVVPPAGPIPCDSVIAFGELYDFYKEHPVAANTPFGMIYWYLSQAYFGYQVPEWQFLQMRDSCQKQTCDSSNIQIWDEYGPFLNGYGECTPVWAIEFIYQSLLNRDLHYADICSNLSNCGIQCPDTCAGPVTPCDIILQVNQAAQSVFVNYGARDTSYIINLFYTYLTGDSITQEQFYIQLDSCQNTCNHSVEVAMRNYGSFFASFDTCVPRWVVEMAFSQIMSRPVAYAEVCELMAGCGLPCPDTCATVNTPCDSIIQLYNTLQHVFETFTRADTAGVTANMTQQLFGTTLTWQQLLSQYRHCTGTEGPTLCNRPLLPPINPEAEDSCFEVMQEYAYHNAAYAYEEYLRNLHEDFVNKYIEKCLGAYKHENFDYTHPNGEYHYTLYYYDQGGNLVKTIPPSGFKSQLVTTPTPHLLPTVYRYNTLNQVVEQRTPDAGTSRFWYDRIGKLIFSENAKQRPLGQFSYTLYDPLQRIKEVGQFDGVDMSIYGNWDVFAMDPTMYWYTYLNATTNATQLTRTYYDEDIYTTGGKYLRNRVAHATYEDVDDHNVTTFQSATHYSYDIHGNVDKLIQVNSALAAIGHDKKTLEYRYDLLSGKVNQVIYQRGQPDQFIHRYDYDGDNRITDVYTSRDNVVEDHDAYYQYYLHGPLARTQLGGNLITGRQSVQGLDYTYTLQGWLKGVNSSALTTATDPGRDGIGALTARDRFGFTLGYYDGDFQPIAWGGTITAANHIEADISLLAQKGLYNGNIASMAVNVGVLNAPLAYKFSYDLLNRLKATDAFDGLDPAQNQWLNNTALTAYHNELTYDANGNIITNKRNGTATTPDMDDMTYDYYAGTNRLRHVSDNVATANYTVDIDNQTDADNYKYDAIGNLVQDVAEGINNIEWNLAGKISAIYKTNGDIMRFAYSPNGNRISKEYYTAATTSTKHTYYTHDATGNIMATYDEADGVLTLAEQPIYGSARIGEIMPKLQLYPAPAAVTDPFITQVSYHMLNKKQYELSNHLGNVQTTISDRRLAIGSPFDHYEVEVVSAQDYYPFGMVMPEREYYTERYRFGFNGKEEDDELKGNGNSLDFGDRLYDPRLGRWNKVDALQTKYPGYSPYHFGYCNPIITIDVDGEENIVVVGNQGYSPKSDKQAGKYRYGENRRHFLEAGLNEALRLKQDNTQGTEGTTLVIYKGNYSTKELASYKQRAEKAGITVVEVSSAKEITNYVNEKTAQGTEKGKENARSSDLITDFSYVGHGWTKALYTGYNAIENDADYDALYTSTFNTEAFDLKCNVNLNACASGYDVMDDFVNRLTGGEVTGYTTTIIWGEKGLGSNRPYEKWYYPPGDPRRESYDRPTVPEADRTRTEQGTRTK